MKDLQTKFLGIYEKLSKEQAKCDNSSKKLLHAVIEAGLLGNYDWEISSSIAFEPMFIEAREPCDLEVWKFFMPYDKRFEIEGVGALWILWNKNLVLTLDALADATAEQIYAALSGLGICRISIAFSEMNLDADVARYTKRWQHARNVITAARMCNA